VEFAKLEAVDPDSDVCVEGIRVDSAINLYGGVRLLMSNAGDELEVKKRHVQPPGQCPI